MFIDLKELKNEFNLDIKGILHIGAHECEEALSYKDIGIHNDKIIWIEANPNLIKNNIKHYLVLDKDDVDVELNLSNNGQSSSILKFGTHKKYYKGVKYVEKIKMKSSRIDTIYKIENIPENFANFLNLDIQGVELLALKGAGELLEHFDYIYTEVNNEELYKDCCLIDDIDEYLLKFGFKRVKTYWTKHKWGDAFYIKF